VKRIDERAVKLEARLAAIEFMICELFSAAYHRVPAEQVHLRHDQLLGELRKRGVRGLDPAMSDLFSAEAENALRDLTRQIESYVRKPRPKAAK
jgi:hypothetical protein